MSNQREAVTFWPSELPEEVWLSVLWAAGEHESAREENGGLRVKTPLQSDYSERSFSRRERSEDPYSHRSFGSFLTF